MQHGSVVSQTLLGGLSVFCSIVPTCYGLATGKLV